MEWINQILRQCLVQQREETNRTERETENERKERETDRGISEMERDEDGDNERRGNAGGAIFIQRDR